MLGDDPASRAAALRYQNQNQSVLTFLNSDARRLKARLARRSSGSSITT